MFTFPSTTYSSHSEITFEAYKLYGFVYKYFIMNLCIIREWRLCRCCRCVHEACSCTAILPESHLAGHHLGHLTKQRTSTLRGKLSIIIMTRTTTKIPSFHQLVRAPVPQQHWLYFELSDSDGQDVLWGEEGTERKGLPSLPTQKIKFLISEAAWGPPRQRGKNIGQFLDWLRSFNPAFFHLIVSL